MVRLVALASVLWLAAFALVAGIAQGKSLGSVTAAVLALAPAYEDRNVDPEVKRRQLETIASAIDSAGRTRLERAMLVGWGDAESKFALEVHQGNCRKPRCDWHPKLGFRARGPWQNWKLWLTDAEWARMVGVENTQFQANEAARRVRGALGECKGSIRGAYAVLAGLPCNGTFRGLNERVEVTRRVLARIGG